MVGKVKFCIRKFNGNCENGQKRIYHYSEYNNVTKPQSLALKYIFRYEIIGYVDDSTLILFCVIPRR